MLKHNKNPDEYKIYYFLVVPGNCDACAEDLLYTCDIWGVDAKSREHAIERLKSQVYAILDTVYHYQFYSIYKVPEGREAKILLGGR